MKVLRSLAGLTLFLLAVNIGVTLAQQRDGAAAPPRPPGMRLVSTAWPDGGQIPLKHTSAGMSISPALQWSSVPPGTVSFVLLFKDPDVAQNKGLGDVTHWLVWNIPGTATGLPEGVPTGAQMPDGSRQISLRGPQYMGPGAGPNGPFHHYTFELYALDTATDIPPGANANETRANVFKAIDGHVLAKAVYVGLYHQTQ